MRKLKAPARVLPNSQFLEAAGCLDKLELDYWAGCKRISGCRGPDPVWVIWKSFLQSLTSAFHVELLPAKCSLMVHLLHHQIPSGAVSNSPSSSLADALLNPWHVPLDARGGIESLCVWTAPFPRGFPRASCVVVNKEPLFIQQLCKDQAQRLQCVKTPGKLQLPAPQSGGGMQIFPFFFYNVKTANVTGFSPRCKCL